MFTGFASENTPAIQVWEYSRAVASSSALRSISLADDCAPIQYFRTGGTASSSINLYLPSCPIEGKQIKIINARYGSTSQFIIIYSSDTNQSGSIRPLYTLGAGQTLDLCYSKNFISFGPVAGSSATGWITLNQSSTSAVNYYAVSFGNNNAATGISSAVIGGGTSLASGDNAFIGGGLSNTASNSYAFVGGGSSNTASGTNAFIGGGTSNQASGLYSAIVGGQIHIANANGAVVVGGSTNVANANSSTVVGGERGTSRSVNGNFVTPASNQPITNLTGATQAATLLLATQTTDATATVLTSNTSAAGTTNQVILPNNSAYFFTGEVVAGVTGGGNTKGWTIEGVIKRGANAASTALVGTATVTSLYADAGAATWSIAVTADTTNGGLKVEVTGQAATTIRWVAQIRTTETAF